jgi:hypothetical protein
MISDNYSYRNYGDSCSGVYPPEDFEGLWMEHWSNGQLKFRGQYKRKLKRVGQHISFYENGVLQEVSCWDEGWACGTVIWFREDGSKECEKDYGEHGGLTRSWTEKCYSMSGQLHAVRVHRDDKLVAEWVDPESRKLWEAIGADKIVEEAVKMVYPDEKA